MLEALIGLRHNTQKTERTSAGLFEKASDFGGIQSPSYLKIHLEVYP